MPVVVQVRSQICFTYHGHNFHSLEKDWAISQPKLQFSNPLRKSNQ